jgi:hypothetical protein
MNKLYLVEIKLGNVKIKRYILNSEMLGRLIQENINNYEYVKILEEIPNEELTKPKTRKRKR